MRRASQRNRPAMSPLRRALLVTICLVLATGVAGLGWTAIEIARQSRRDEAKPSDVIVVLGAAEYMGRPSPVLRARLDHALSLYEQHLAPRILVTGGSGENSRFTEAEAARDYLVRQGVPGENILLEAEGTTTLQSINAAAEIMEQRGLRSSIVVSDGYHVFRAKRMLEHRGLRAYGSPRQSPEGDPLRQSWLYLRQSAGYWLWVLRLSR